MTRIRTLILVVLAVVLVTGVGVVGVHAASDDIVEASGGQSEVEGEPGLDVTAADNTVPAGAERPVELVVSNNGTLESGTPEQRQIVTTARNVRVTGESDAPESLTVEGGTRAIGPVGETEPRTVPLRIRVPEDTPPGEYDVEVELEYAYTSTFSPADAEVTDESDTVTRTVTIEVDDAPAFRVVDSESAVSVGDEGRLTLSIENVGNQTARDVSVIAERSSPRVGFGESSTDEAHVTTWEPGEVRTIEYDVAAASDATPRSYSLDLTLEYTDEDGVRGTDTDVPASVTFEESQSFAIENVESTLRVDEDGDIRGEVRNEGPHPVSAVVVRFAAEDAALFPREHEFAVGELDPGETADFRFPIDVGSEAEAVRKQFPIDVQYRNVEGERRVNDDNDVVAEIEPVRDEFLLETDTDSLEAGETIAVTFTVTNNRDQRLTDIEAKFFTDSPLDSADDEGYVSALDPGESAEITFEVSAASNANPRTYPVSLDFRYDDERGTSQVSDTYRIAFDVQPAEEGLPLWPVLAVAVLLLLVGGYWWRGR